MRLTTSFFLAMGLAFAPSVSSAECVSLEVINATLYDLAAVTVVDYDDNSNVVVVKENVPEGGWVTERVCIEANRLLVIGLSVGQDHHWIYGPFAISSGRVALDETNQIK